MTFGASWWRARGEVVTLRISRMGTELHDPLKGAPSVTRAALGYIAAEGKVKMFTVGHDEVDLRDDIERAKRAGELPASFSVVSPGQSEWWDNELRWPPIKGPKLKPPPDDTQALFHNPFQKDVWCLPGVEGFLSYIIFQALGLPSIVWLRRTIKLEIGSEFDSVERAEIVDAVEARWGRSRVIGADDVPRLFRPLDYAAWALLAIVYVELYLRVPRLMMALSVAVALLGVWWLRRLEKVAPRR